MTEAVGTSTRRLSILGRLLTAIGLFFVCLALYFAHFEARSDVGCISAPYAAWSLVRQGNFDLSGYRQFERCAPATVVALADGRRVSRLAPGSTIAALPFVAPFARLSETPLRPVEMRRLGKLVAAAHTAAAVVLFYFICRVLARTGARRATLVFAFGSCVFSVASQALWPHGPALFWVTLALYLLVAGGEHGGWIRFAWIGFALGMAVAVRPPTALFGVATVAALGWRGRWQAILRLGVGAALPCAALYSYDAYHFAELGEPILAGYLAPGSSWTTPISVGLSGLLIAPSRGLLVYTPALLLVPWGLRALVARQAGGGSFARTMLLFWLGGVVASLLLFARFNGWSGEWAYGPRHLIESLPVLCALFALAVASPRFETDGRRKLVLLLVSLSLAVHAIGVFADDRGAWHRRHPESMQLFELRDTQIEAAARHLLRLRPAPNPRR